jgi:Flp pilus assembly protein TadG
MRERRTRARARAQRGAVAVEAAIVLTLIIIPLTFTIISYAYMFSFRQALSQAASEGARAAVGATTDGERTTAATAAINSALSNYTEMKCGEKYLTCTIDTSPTTCASGHSCISVTVGYPYRSEPLLPTIPFTGWVLPPNIGFTSVVETN